MAHGTDKDTLPCGFQPSDFHVGMMYKRFFDAAGDMRFISSGRGKLLDVNQAGVELFGYCSKEELLGLDNVEPAFLQSRRWTSVSTAARSGRISQRI